MSCPGIGPCQPFATELDLCCLVTGAFEDPCINGTNVPVPQDLIDNALQAASEVLWTATGRQFGTCQVKIRPCNQGGEGCNPCGEGGGELPFWSTSSAQGFDWGGFPWTPAMSDTGVWTNVSCSCKDCCDVCHIDLPYPVCSIDEVRLNGNVLGTHLYRVDDFRQLVRLGGLVTTTPLTSLNTVATTDPEMPTITASLFVGPGLPPVYPNPTNIGSTDAGTGCGVYLPSDGTTYQFQWSNNFVDLRYDPEVIVCLPLGQLNQTFSVGGIANGQLHVTPVSGVTPAQISVAGNIVTISAAGIANEPICVRVSVRNNNSSFQAIYVTPINTGGNGLAVCELSWSDQASDNVCWPDCQNLLLPDTEPNTFSVTLTYGRPVPAIIKMATAELACQFIKACVGQPCLLPQRVQSISRQGVTVGFLDPMDFLAQGRTGIYLVDMAVSRYNPKSLLKQASVYSSDVGHRWRVTNTDR